METLLETTPPTQRAFELWVRDCIAEIEPLIVGDEFGESTLASVAKIVRRAKAHAYRLGLYGLANAMPERPFKTPLDGLLRLRECLQSPTDSALLDAGQVATMLGVSVRTVWRKRSAGELPDPVELGGLTKWRRIDIENWLGV